MRAYIIRRLLLLIPTVLLVTIIAFILIRIVPGDVVSVYEARLSRFGELMDPETIRAELERRFGLDVPIYVQYGRWLGVVSQADGSYSGLFQGNLGESYWNPSNVLDEIALRWPVTVELGLLALIIAQLIALPIGVFSALRQDTWGDYLARSFAIMMIAIPGFWMATMVVVLGSIWVDYSPPFYLIPFTKDPIGNLRMFILPALLLGMSMSGVTMRMTRTMMLEVLRQDYIRTAWAKGLRERVVVMRHALKNALIPVVTMIGLQVPVMIGGAVIIEQIFALPGMGNLIVDATGQRDYPIVNGVILIFALGIVAINLIVDLTYAYLDPRIRYK